MLGPDGAIEARAVTEADQCPSLNLDGKTHDMAVRAGPAIEPKRPTASPADLSKPSRFPVLTCEARIPAKVRSATVGRHRLALPKVNANRIVVIGDTGCRLKAADDAWQACNDPAAYPFARIAARAAAWKPDLVIHVGDYLYRENPCPAGQSGCAGSPWGYGWDAWDADFFTPARKLLEAAPWVMVRGNHENCVRAGQGWWRFLDPRALEPGRDCNDPANDVTGDYSQPYAVPLGKGAQVVVMDLSHAGEEPIAPSDPRFEQYKQTSVALKYFTEQARFTFAADHYPIFGVAAERKHDAIKLYPGNQALQSVFSALDPHILPKGVDTLLSGHIHVWEQVDFAGRQPSQFVAGFSGTQEDIVPLPKQLPPGVTPAPDASVRQFSSIVDKFGYMTLERIGKLSWKAKVNAIDGSVLKVCYISGRASRCSAH
ncbi:metallophosphoesterase [Qipengyuania algicida]|uniref:metallophosphoesterase family protein n=1 Tax=Qipengyuania algicida TaxID=1836209 RepID=UPI00301D7ECE